jgi:hypothetical protein
MAESIIELPYKSPPTGDIYKQRIGVFIPLGGNAVRSEPFRDANKTRFFNLPKDKPVDIVASLQHPNGDMWLKLSGSKAEWVAFVYGDDILGEVRGWSKP